ncbi:protein phosphatase 2C domain-containing protein [bacterium]|nr:protein phosphatase 2C domain-containing protein [bacterium]
MPRLFTFTEAGDHPANEDAFVAAPHPADPACWVVRVADGQGGRGGGARAARLACDTAAAGAFSMRPAELTNAGAWTTILGTADAAVAADPEAGFTTLIGLAATDRELAGASVGDSAALLWVSSRTRRSAAVPPTPSRSRRASRNRGACWR